MARIGITALLFVAASAPAAQAQSPARVVLMERAHHTRLGDALERELDERGIALERHYDPGGPPEARAARARDTTRRLGAAAAVWVEEPEGRPPVVAVVAPQGEAQRWPMAMQAARVPARSAALMATHMLDEIVPQASKMTLEVEVERVRDGVVVAESGNGPGPVSETEPATATAAETQPATAIAAETEDGTRWRLAVGAIGVAHADASSPLLGGGTRLAIGPRLGGSRVRAEAFGWLAATDRVRYPALGGAGLSLRLEPEAELGVLWGANATLLVAREREPVQQGARPVNRLLGWRAGVEAGVRWRLSDVLDIELAADLGVARLDRGDVRFAPMVTLGLGLTP